MAPRAAWQKGAAEKNRVMGKKLRNRRERNLQTARYQCNEGGETRCQPPHLKGF